jgi:hypothetical protein
MSGAFDVASRQELQAMAFLFGIEPRQIRVLEGDAARAAGC